MTWLQPLAFLEASPIAPFLQILTAALLGSGVGWERERHGRAAGLRTHMLLCTGCALIMLVSLRVPALFAEQTAEGVVRADPGRLAGHALSGLGFLGAGAIIVLGPRIRGLTTAASIWVTAAIGLAIGAGCLGPAVFTWMLVMFALLMVGRWEKRITRKDKYIHLLLTFRDSERRMDAIKPLLDAHSFDLLQCTTDRIEQEMLYRMALRYGTAVDFEEVTAELADKLKDRGLTRIEWRE